MVVITMATVIYIIFIDHFWNFTMLGWLVTINLARGNYLSPPLNINQMFIK